MDFSLIYNISVYGRFVFGICCLNRTIKYYEDDNDVWRKILDKMSDATNVDYIDDWYYEIVEYLPDNILGNQRYNCEENEYISEELFYKLKLTFSNSHKIVLDVFQKVIRIISFELYSSIVYPSNSTYNIVLEIIELMNKNNILVPDLNNFAKFEFVQNGWGIPISKNEINRLMDL